MATITIHDPTGVEWAVRRRWVPHRDGKGVRERWRRRPETDGLADGLGLAGDAADIPVVGVVAAVVAVLLFVVLMTIWFPFVVLLAVDLVWLSLVVVVGAVGRIVLRRPWRVEARSDDDRREWFVHGYRAAGQLRDELAIQFRHGANPTPSGQRLLTN